MKFLALVLVALALVSPVNAGIDPDLIIFRRGDVNGDGNINITDTVYLSNFLFSGGPPPPCFEAADVDGDGGLDIVDFFLIWDHLFGGNPIPFEEVNC